MNGYEKASRQLRRLEGDAAARFCQLIGVIPSSFVEIHC
jgi:hypothetical protein